jgi:hypothetical protein
MLTGGRVAVVSKADPRTVSIWDADGAQPLLVLPAEEGPVQTFAADPAGRCLV